jgi:cytochrome c551/c552
MKPAKTKMKKLLILTVIAYSLFLGCKHDSIPLGTDLNPVPVSGGNNGGTATGGDTVCFNSEVLPLFQSYCGNSGCHNASSARSGVVLTDYFNIMKGIRANNPGSSKYYKIIGSGMPPRGSSQMSSAQTAVILKWINQGALNTVCSSAACDSTQYTYSNGISQLLTTYCVACHGSSGASAGVVLSSYASAKAAVTSQGATFLNSINFKMSNPAQNMPPAAPLSSCQITQVTKWINSGMPQ